VNKLVDEEVEADDCSVYEDVVFMEENHHVVSPVVCKAPSKVNVVVSNDDGHASNIHQPVFVEHGGSPLKLSRTTSCPEVKGTNVSSGPWSIEWLNDHYDADVGVASFFGDQGYLISF